MKRRSAHLLLWLYPRSWRRRYGEEFAALLAQQRLTLNGVLDLARGAYDAHRTAMRRRDARGKERKMARRQSGMLCSFCGKSQYQVRRLIAGPNSVYICDECISLCNEILAETPPSLAPSGVATYGTLESAHAPWWRRLGRRCRTNTYASPAQTPG
ncbi:MAG TPA: ClpX C4-type zinc finger protein [Ktedonobacterales bacterium]|jgi:hypothetical protein|nr:ClpX C4-type zinc finger protein [Ktedonobacterales bacterium]